MNNLSKILLWGVCLSQLVIVFIAEYDEDYLKASYEMLWLVSFAVLLHWEYEKDE